MQNKIRNFISNESGATAIEYGLIAGLVSVALITVLNTMSGSLGTTFTRISTALSGA